MEQEYILTQKRIKRVLLLGTFTTYNKPWHDISDTLSILNSEFTFSWKRYFLLHKWYVTLFIFTNEENKKERLSKTNVLLFSVKRQYLFEV